MLTVHRAERADRLVAALADVLSPPPADPFTPDLVAVPTRGIERWLAQELSLRLGTRNSRGDGVCANVEFPFPATVTVRALAAASDLDPDRDPWRPERLVWPVLAELEDALHTQALAPLRAHLGDAPDDPRRNRRWAAARRIADLFDRYGVHRPQMLRYWLAGRDVDGAEAELPSDAVWQARLWRQVRQRLDCPSPPERLAAALPRLAEGVDVPDLPARLSLFGLTALPASYVDILAALARHRDVHLFLLHPSPALWARVAAARHGPHLARRDHDPTRELPRHPLLASWGRDAREMQLVVARVDPVDDELPAAPEVPEMVTDPPSTTLLARIQADIRADRPPPGPPRGDDGDRRLALAEDDRSLRIHACHGRLRQVEVLRDAILHLLADDPTLQPRDIVVMCPDIEEFAPLVRAVFDVGRVGGRPDASTGAPPWPPDLRVRLADRALRQTNPLLRVLDELLALAAARLTASEVLDLAAREPVRRRFGFTDTDLELLDHWAGEACVRWGLDGAHRARLGLAGVAANTWRAGLDRILLGVAMAGADDRLFGGALPLDVEGDSVDLAGRLAEFLDRLGEALGTLRDPLPVSAWTAALSGAADALTDTAERDRWQRHQLRRVLDDVVSEATLGTEPAALTLRLPEIRALLADRLRGRPTRANHRTGDLTVCTLVPMRSVPHRVVCLLGLDDQSFPRRPVADGDDLIERDPRVGDRDARTEDRQLLLDALMAAQETLVVTYTGRDDRTNEPRPPAVPVAELLDVVDRTARLPQGSARQQVLREHPLQPFDPRVFSPAAPAGRPWGFDPVALAGARAAAGPRHPAPPFLAGPLPPLDEPVVSLDDLVAFLGHPTRAFLRRRLGVRLPRRSERPSEAIPVVLSGLERYDVGERLLRARLAGTDPQRWAAGERARGTLPPGNLGERELEQLGPEVEDIVAAVRRHCDAGLQPATVAVDVDLADGRRLQGEVAGVVGDTLLTVAYGKLKARRRLQAWARLLAVTAAEPARVGCALLVGRPEGQRDSGVVGLAVAEGPPERRRQWALGHLACLVDLYDRGMREPLPLYTATSAAYAETLLGGGRRQPLAAARKAWEDDRFGEGLEPEHLVVLGEQVPVEALFAAPPGPGEEWHEAVAETSRFGRCAVRLWAGLLQAQHVEPAEPEPPQ